MTTIDNLKPEELSQVFDKVKWDIEMVLANNGSGESFRFLSKLQGLISKANLPAEQSKSYDDYVTLLKLVALPVLQQSEIQELLSTRLKFGLAKGYDIRQRIKLLFSYYPDADDFKKVDWLLRSMEANSEALVNLITLSDNKQYPGTIGNVIRLYKNSSYFKEGGGTLSLANFLANDANLKMMPKEAVQSVQEILSLYEWIRLKATVHDDSPPAPIDIVAKPIAAVPTPPAPSPVQPVQPAQAAPPERQLTDFEKKLAEINAQHPADFEELKHKMEETAGAGKTGEVVQEVKQEVIEVKKQMDIKPEAPVRNLQPPPIAVPMNEIRAPKVYEQPSFDLEQVKTIDDLKKIEVAHLRAGEIKVQAERIKSKILSVMQQGRMLPFYVVSAFEQSPLFKAYIFHGNAKFSGQAANELTQEEFETIADLRKEIERL